MQVGEELGKKVLKFPENFLGFLLEEISSILLFKNKESTFYSFSVLILNRTLLIEKTYKP